MHKLQHSSTQQQRTQVLIPTEKASNSAKKTLSQTFSFKGIDNMLYINNGFVANYDETKLQGHKIYKLLRSKSKFPQP